MTAARFGHTELPEEQQAALRCGKRLTWLSIAFLATAITLMYLVMGSSQAMKAAWAEDLLSLIPPIAFLVAVRRAKRPPTPEHPYGYHRAVGAGHLVAATALLTMGLFLVWDSASGLLKAKHPPVGLIEIGGWSLWSGWLMIAALAYSAVPPVLLGRAKLPVADTLHDRVLYADADMNKADWMTALGGIVGILGIGVGLWWADAAAALFIAGGILKDGWKNMRTAVGALMDARAETVEGDDPHPLVADIEDSLRTWGWVRDARARVRDQGHVFHVEAFVVPVVGHAATLDELRELRERLVELDWKIDDVVVAPVEEIPPQLEPGEQAQAQEQSDA